MSLLRITKVYVAILDFNAWFLISSQWFLAELMRFQLVSDPSGSSHNTDLSQVTTLQYCIIDNCTIMSIDTGQQLDIVYYSRLPLPWKPLLVLYFAISYPCSFNSRHSFCILLLIQQL